MNVESMARCKLLHSLKQSLNKRQHTQSNIKVENVNLSTAYGNMTSHAEAHTHNEVCSRHISGSNTIDHQSANSEDFH